MSYHYGNGLLMNCPPLRRLTMINIHSELCAFCNAEKQPYILPVVSRLIGYVCCNECLENAKIISKQLYLSTDEIAKELGIQKNRDGFYHVKVQRSARNGKPSYVEDGWRLCTEDDSMDVLHAGFRHDTDSDYTIKLIKLTKDGDSVLTTYNYLQELKKIQGI